MGEISQGIPVDRQVSEEPTFGMKLVGYTFNPSKDPRVDKAKQLCAQLADLLYDKNESEASTYIGNIIFESAITEILNAQMNAVKYLTLQY